VGSRNVDVDLRCPPCGTRGCSDDIREASALAGWVALHERRLTTIYITHGHSDHYLGLSVLSIARRHAKVGALGLVG
jgi:glyoxylase-like metal-dependent hydrolase (beta-lactamase superfamily II)